MIEVENDYETIKYEQPFSSHINENQLELLHDYYTRPINNNSQITQEVNEINTVTNLKEKTKYNARTQIMFIKTFKKKQPREKIWTIPFLLESPRSEEFQSPNLEIGFLIDSGAESNIINIPISKSNCPLFPQEQ